MTTAKRTNRKISDAEIIRYNSVGLSMASIAKRYGCHQTVIALRLKALNIPPADTRRSFMEDIFTALSPDQQEWLMNQLGPHTPVKDFMKNLLVKEFVSHVS